MQFLYNCWYVAAWADEIGRTLFHRRILDMPLVLYRTEGGEPVALLDRCPHKWAPLHRGKLIGDTVQCGYHGLCFDAKGACAHNPYSDTTPAAARVRSFPLVEKDSLIWIWTGDPEKADASSIIDCSYINDTRKYRTVKGNHIVGANYAFIIDNLMDLSHSTYVHPTTFGTDALMGANYEVKAEGTSIQSNRWYKEGPSLPLLEHFLPTNGKPVEHWVNMRFDIPASLVLDLGMTLAGRPRSEGWTAMSPNILTPETMRSTHYFYSYSRTMHLDSKEIDGMLSTGLQQAFRSEDAPMLEAVQSRFDDEPTQQYSTVLLPADAGANRARRLLQSLIDAENKTGTREP